MGTLEPRVVTTRARDGTALAFALYLPIGDGPFPTLFAASPYRFDNNILPHGPQFLWRETGPIEFYLEQGYAYIHMDARGCGRTGGHFEFLGPNEQSDLFDAIAWVSRQSWCNGRIGSIGQSYYCMLQWFMAIQAPPGLACVGAHDGLTDPYRAAAYHGGIPCDFFASYWWNQNRIINAFPANDGPSRIQETDLNRLLAEHPTLDDFWHVRSASERLDQITLPLYSSGVWSKMQLHTRGNIDGFRKARGPKKLRMSGVPNAFAAADEFNSVGFHQRVMLPFYDHYLKGLPTDFVERPAIEYAVRGSTTVRSAEEWPPAGTRYDRWYLASGPSGSVTSLNDGRLLRDRSDASPATSYEYPQRGWVNGTAGFGPNGPAGGFDPARRILTFTSDPLPNDVEICGPIKLELFASSSRTDTDFFVKVMDQAPQSSEARGAGINPMAEAVSRGWLRASHRALDAERSTEMEPVHSHGAPQPLVPDEVTRFDVSIEPTAYLFKAGHRIRLDLANGDSAVTEALWSHHYAPNKIGRDTIHHTAIQPSCLILPISALS